LLHDGVSAGARAAPSSPRPEYLTHMERTTVNKSFTASGKLEVTLTPG
jgi:hypothetical protein